jgi:hypothetical protein
VSEYFQRARPEPVEAAIVVRQDENAALEAPAKRSARSGPKWEADTQERVRAGVRKFAKPLADIAARDEFNDLTTEYQVKGEFADYGVRIDRELVAFIEVKRVATKLAAKHLRQAEMYAVNEGVEWIILTNGAVWRAYHLGAGLPVEIDLALEVDLLGDETPAQKANQLFYLSRESLKRRQIDELWRARRATSPKSLGAVLTTPSVADAIRKQLRKDTGQNVGVAELSKLLKETVIRPECL